MQGAIKGATTFLLKVAKDTNPIPYGLFKSSISRQVKWAAERGDHIDFDVLAAEVKKGLNYQHVQVMPDRYAQQQEEASDKADSAGGFYLDDSDTFILKINEGISNVFGWLYSVFEKAEREHVPTISFKAEMQEGETN